LYKYSELSNGTLQKEGTQLEYYNRSTSEDTDGRDEQEWQKKLCRDEVGNESAYGSKVFGIREIAF
jgi:hypothetical protein